MSNELFVGGVPFQQTEEETKAALEQMFGEIGEVLEVKVIDRIKNIDGRESRSKFAFVKMATPELAEEAVTKLNGAQMEGRNITVSIARPREERPPRRDGGFGGNRGGYNGGGGSGYGGQQGGRDNDRGGNYAPRDNGRRDGGFQDVSEGGDDMDAAA